MPPRRPTTTPEMNSYRQTNAKAIVLLSLLAATVFAVGLASGQVPLLP